MNYRRKTGLWLIAFALTSFASMVLTDVPDIGESNQQALEFYASNTGPAKTLVAFYLAAAAAGCLLGVLSSVLPAIWRSGRDALAATAWAAGGGYATVTVVAASLFVLPTATAKLGFAPGPVDPVFARSMSTIGDAMLMLTAPLLLSLCLAAACRGAARTEYLPLWFTRTGTLVAATLVVGWMWFPLILLVLWTLVSGIALSTSRLRTPPTSLEIPYALAPSDSQQRA